MALQALRLKRSCVLKIALPRRLFVQNLSENVQESQEPLLHLRTEIDSPVS